jgi:phosphoribosylformimino-5-aminoimidazole carboxamide ribotide isomerase
MKVLAAIDLMGGQVVRLVRGAPENKTVYSNNPPELARKWAEAGASMLHIVDLDAAFGSGDNSKSIGEIISALRSSGGRAEKIPLQISGGIRSIESAEDLLSSGNASKVVIGTLAYNDAGSIKKLSKKYPDRVVISIDQKEGRVMVKGWKESTGVRVGDAIAQFRSIGINEFLLTSIDRDGTLGGPDLSALSSAAYSGARIIASGGISQLEDILKVKSVGCTAVVLGKALYDDVVSIDKAKAIA